MPPPPHLPPFEIEAFLSAPDLSPQTSHVEAGALVYAQGEPCEAVYFIQEGSVKLSVLRKPAASVTVTPTVALAAPL